MKKAISILLALLLVFTLFACTNKDAETTDAESAGTSEEASATSEDASATSEDASVETGEDSETPAALEDITVNADLVGYFEDGIDPQSRRTYNFINMYPLTLDLYVYATECLEEYAERLNYTVTTSTTENDFDMYIQNIEIFAQEGDVDGFIIVIDVSTSDRIKEVLDETGIPYIAWCNSVRDENGSNIVPCIGLDHYGASKLTMEWLYDNYKTYWGDIDTSKIALLNTNSSTNPDLNSRAVAAEETFNALIPDNAGVFEVDIVSDYTMENAYNKASPIFTANPDIEYWFSTNTIDIFAGGVARAAEALGIDDNVLAVCVGQSALVKEWDEAGYDGCWAACYAVSNYTQVVPAASALVAIIDGKATWDTLWTAQRAEGDLYTFLAAPGDVVSIDTYKDWHNKYAEAIGQPLPY